MAASGTHLSKIEVDTSRLNKKYIVSFTLAFGTNWIVFTWALVALFSSEFSNTTTCSI